MRLTKTCVPILMLTACLTGDDVADELTDDDLATAEAEIARGTLVPNAWTVGMVQLLRSNGSFYCSGTAIAPDWVLTAGHCGVQANQDTVRLGNADDPYAQTSAIDRVVGNPAMDLALVHLSRALDVQNRGLDYKLSLFPDLTKTLLGKRARFYGSSNDPTCSGASCGYGFLRYADVTIDKFGAHNLGGTTTGGQASVAGDSGGGLVYETTAGRELAGVLKCGLSDCLVRPDAFRTWALAYLYDRPVELPEIWNYGANAGAFFAVPLQHNYAASTTWDVCPGGQPWTYKASYELETNRDFLKVRSNQPEVTLSGVGSYSGSGAGPLILSIQTNGAVASRGLTGFAVTCNAGLRFPNPWGVPSPAGTNDVKSWDPCPGNAAWQWTAEYDYRNGGNGMVGTRVLTGTSTTSGTGRGPINVASYTPAGGTDGMRKLTARCDLALPCHGSTCFSRSDVGSSASSAAVTWTPCNGGGFRYRASYDLNPTYDFLRISGGTTNEYLQRSGRGTTEWRRAGGSLAVTLAMSMPRALPGVKELVAQCDAWGADRTSTVQVVSATYGRNCRVNRDNVTQKVVAACKAQGGSRCNYTVNTSTLGDPAYGCAKDFTAEWTCGTATALNKLVLSGEANGKTAALTCP